MPAPRINPRQSQTIADSDQGSRKKAESAAERTTGHVEMAVPESWPRGSNGQPMVKIAMTASELIPTGQYANVSIGPCQITAFVDQSRSVVDEDGLAKPYFSEEERGTLAQALNELAEIVEGDVVAVQRNIVLENLQDKQLGN